MNENALTVIQETKILGKEVKVYKSVEEPLFEASEVAEWLGIKNVSQMLKQAEIPDAEKGIFLKYTLGGNQNALFITEDAMYDILMSSRKKDEKPMRREIKKYLKSIRLTGAAIVDEQKTVDYYFSSFSEDLKTKIFNEMYQKNQELQQFYDDLMNTDGLYHMNTVAKELKIGRNTLFAYLRGKDIMFYQDNVNVPYQRFMNQKLFSVIESPCADGKYRPTTYATKKGLDYIRKLLHKDGYYDAEVA